MSSERAFRHALALATRLVEQCTAAVLTPRLLEAIETSTTTLAEASEATMTFLREHIDEARTVPLCGNSIGTDRRFLLRWLPEIEEFLHDVPLLKKMKEFERKRLVPFLKPVTFELGAVIMAQGDDAVTDFAVALPGDDDDRGAGSAAAKQRTKKRAAPL